jgi:hypothetical protein
MPPHYPVKVLIICLNPSLVHSLHKANNRVRTREVRLVVDNLSKLSKDHPIKDSSFNMLNNISIQLKCNIIYNSKCQGIMGNILILQTWLCLSNRPTWAGFKRLEWPQCSLQILCLIFTHLQPHLNRPHLNLSAVEGYRVQILLSTALPPQAQVTDQLPVYPDYNSLLMVWNLDKV